MTQSDAQNISSLTRIFSPITLQSRVSRCYLGGNSPHKTSDSVLSSWFLWRKKAFVGRGVRIKPFLRAHAIFARDPIAIQLCEMLLEKDEALFRYFVKLLDTEQRKLHRNPSISSARKFNLSCKRNRGAVNTSMLTYKTWCDVLAPISISRYVSRRIVLLFCSLAARHDATRRNRIRNVNFVNIPTLCHSTLK